MWKAGITTTVGLSPPEFNAVLTLVRVTNYSQHLPNSDIFAIQSTISMITQRPTAKNIFKMQAISAGKGWLD